MTDTISIDEQFQLPVAPDTAFIKLHFAGEGMTLVDASKSVAQKVADAKQHLTREYDQITSIDTYDVYTGQKDDGIRSESQAFPRPLVVQGLLVSLPPADQLSLCNIADDLIKQGAQPSNPHRRSYISDTLDSALLFGVVNHQPHESEAIAACIDAARQRAHTSASAATFKIGELKSISNVKVEPSCAEPFKKDYIHIRRSFPTPFLSPTPAKVLFCASLTAEFTLVAS